MSSLEVSKPIACRRSNIAAESPIFGFSTPARDDFFTTKHRTVHHKNADRVLLRRPFSLESANKPLIATFQTAGWGYHGREPFLITTFPHDVKDSMTTESRIWVLWTLRHEAPDLLTATRRSWRMQNDLGLIPYVSLEMMDAKYQPSKQDDLQGSRSRLCV